MKPTILLLSLIVGACASSGGAVPLEPRVPAGGVAHPDDPAEPHLTNLRRLTDGGQNAEAYFSADGARLIFQATGPGLAPCDQQFVMGLDGQDLRRVSTGLGRTTCGYFYDGGDRIVYSSTHHVAETCPAEPDRSLGYVWPLYDYDIYTATDDGGDLTRIFRSPVYDAEATLAPGGETIVFTSARDGDLDIYTMRTDGSDVRRLTHEVGYDGGPFFNQDGTKIVYRAHHPTEPEAVEEYRRLLDRGLIRPGALDLWVMDADGSNKTRLTNNGAANFGPFFHPSGDRVIFSSNMHDPRGREFDLYLIGTDGSGLERVTVHPDFDGFPVFSPADPGSFVFASNRGGGEEGETNVFLAEWVDDVPPVRLSAPVFPTSAAAPPPAEPAEISAEAREAHAAAGVTLDRSRPDVHTVACPAFDPDSLGVDVVGYAGRYLADDALHGRLAGSHGAACAAELIAYTFRRLGLAPGGEAAADRTAPGDPAAPGDTAAPTANPAAPPSYFQPVPLASAVNPHAPGGTGRNVLGILPGTDRRMTDQYLVIGAHFDHLGMGGAGSLADERGIHNGADDNASGVAALLRVAERLAVGPRPRRPILFMAFTGEESGLLGSSHWINHPTVPLESVVAMINMDMVGRLGQNGLVVYGTGTAAEWEEILRPELDRVGIDDVGFVPDGYGASDQTAFYARDIPVLHLFTNTHSEYHRPSDDWHLVDTAGIRAIAELVAGLARQVGSRPRMEVVPDVGAPRGRDADVATPGYGAYLGSIPDFSPVDYGVLLSGVREGSPADQAGLRTGDVIVSLGGMEVADLYGLTDALRAHQPGDTVVIEWLREGERMRAETTLERRQ